MKRLLLATYGLAAYASFVAALGLLTLSLEGLAFPLDARAAGSAWRAAALDLGLVALFGFQHSIMARASFKRALARVIPEDGVRSTYVFASSAVLAAIVSGWQPLPDLVFSPPSPVRATLVACSWAGWSLALASSFAYDHWALFGLRQSLGIRPKDESFATPGPYRWVRHPLYLGLLVAFWAAPAYSAGRLLFASSMTLYIFAGIAFEERDLLRQFGAAYRGYRQSVARLIPKIF